MSFVRTAVLWLVAGVSCAFPIGSTLLAADCNQNGVEDSVEIASGSAPDCNTNGVPDDCDVARQLGFATAVNHAVGANPYFVTADDLDGDSDLDLAVANLSLDKVAILLNDGSGVFGPPSRFDVGTRPLSIASGDLDRDGDTDLAVANHVSNDVSILLNRGDGSFGASVNNAVEPDPRAVVASDFDGDGSIDLAVGHFGSNNVSILRNNGNGTFAGPVSYPAGTSPWAVATGDLDGDGALDLAVASTSGNVSVLLNDGSGGFASPANVGVGSRPVFVTTADLDGDSDLDLAVANGFGQEVSVFLGHGDGTFATGVEYPVGPNPSSIAKGDLDGDGTLDLAVANGAGNSISVLVNDGNGIFAMPVNFAVGSTPVSVTAADLDGDGSPDLAGANTNSHNLSVLFNETTSTSDDANANGIPDECEAAGSAFTFTRSDANADGRVDLADAIFLLDWLFRGKHTLPCKDVADTNDDGQVDLTDAIYLLDYLFLGGTPPPLPFPVPGVDPTSDPISCQPCVPSQEVCDGTDNDCDGLVDEDFDFSTDPNNCGSCGVVCSAPNAVMDCVAGRCVIISCAPGFVDLDGDPDNGCESEPQKNSISGFVTDALTGRPIIAAQVSVVTANNNASTDESGFYSIEGLDPGTYGVSATAVGYHDSTKTVQTDTWTRVDFKLQPTGSSGGIEFFDVFGIVVDRNTVLPLENVIVRLRSTSNLLNTTIEETDTTDSEGAYEVQRLPRGQYEFEVAPAGYKPYSEIFVLDANKAKDVYLKAIPATVEGTVRGNRLGTVVPLEGALIRLVGVNAAGNPIFHPVIGMTDAAGHYKLEDLPPLTYTIQVFAPGYRLHEEQITLDASAPLHKDIELTLRSASLQVTLSTSTYNDAPVSNVEVQIQGVGNSPSAGIDVTRVTDATGSVGFTDLVPGTYELSTPSPFFSAGSDGSELYPLRRTVRLGLDELKRVSADLPAVPGRLFGHIRGGTEIPAVRLALAKRRSIRDGTHDGFPYIPEPLSNATIRILDGSFGSIPITLPTTELSSDAKGTYGLSLPAGTYTLELSKDGYVTESRTIEMRSFPRRVNFHLSPTHTTVVGRIDAVTVQDVTNGLQGVFKLEGAQVRLEHGTQTYSAATDERGIFVLERVGLDSRDGAVQRTTFSLRVEHPHYRTLNGTVTLSEAEGVHKILRQLDTLRAFGTLQISLSRRDKDGNVLPASGTLAAVKRIESNDSYDGTSTVTTSGLSLRARPGTYRVRVCPSVPGLSPCYEQTWTSVPGASSNRNLHLLCSDTTRAVKCLRQAGSSFAVEGSIILSGFVFNEETGEPLDGAHVTLNLTVNAEYCVTSCSRIQQRLSGSATTDATGRYEIRLQVPGSNGGTLVDWSWNGTNRHLRFEKPGFEPKSSTGKNQTFKGFTGYFNGYLKPTGLLEGLVLSADAQQPPVQGHNDQLGRRLSVPRTRVMPQGLSFQQNPFEASTSPGLVTVQLEALGHYPYEARNVEVKASGSSKWTFVMEEIPPPQVGPFIVLSRAHNRELRGYVLKGISASATQARFEVEIDRQGMRRLRPGFQDPVSSVHLEIEVAEGCSGVPAPLSTLKFQGRKLSGDASGFSVWEGEFDASDLPCGRLNWTVVAATPRTEIRQPAQWNLWPSEQRFPLSLLTLASYPSSWLPEFLRGSSALEYAPWGLKVQQSALTVKHERQYLKYEIKQLSLGTKLSAPTENKLIRLLGKTVLGIGGVGVGIDGISLDGRNGRLEFNGTGQITVLEAKNEIEEAIGSLKAVSKTKIEPTVTLGYGFQARELFSLDTPVLPTGSTTGPVFRESFRGGLEIKFEFEPPLVALPPPVQWVLSKTGIAALALVHNQRWGTDLSWDLDNPIPGIELPSALLFHRIVKGNTEFKLQAAFDFGLKLKALRGIELGGGMTPEFELSFKGLVPISSLYLDTAKVAGGVFVEVNVWDLWKLRHDFDRYTFYEFKYGSESIGRTGSHQPLMDWTARTWVGPGYGQFAWQSGQDQGLIVSRAYPRAGPALARMASGELLLAAIHDEASESWPNSLRLRTASRDPASGDWSPPASLGISGSTPVLDAAVESDQAGQTLLVWSALPVQLTDPSTFLQDFSSSELYYAVGDPSSGTWSTATRLTADTRPDLAPVLSRDGSGQVFLVWAKDMDGNVTTVDDFVLHASVWNGSTWSAATQIASSNATGSEIGLSASQGKAAVSFIGENRGGEGEAVNVVFFDGVRWGLPKTLASGKPALQHTDVVLVRPDIAVVVWNELDPKAPDGPEEGIRAAEVSLAGAIGPTTSVATADSVSDIEVLLDGAGRPVILWSTDRSQGTNGIYGSARSPSGWSAKTTILEKNVLFDTIDAASNAAGTQVFVTYLEMDGEAASIGFVAGSVGP